MPVTAQLVYHCLGLLFTGVNLVWGAMLWGYQVRDSKWLSDADRTDLEQTSAPRASLVGTAVPSANADPQDGLPQYSEEEVHAHNTSNSCWITIRGKVYDVTTFLQEHPGGASVLLENAGKDASNAFASVGHSNKALTMMEKYAVGVVSQRKVNIPEPQPIEAEFIGNTNVKYEYGRLYYYSVEFRILSCVFGMWFFDLGVGPWSWSPPMAVKTELDAYWLTLFLVATSTAASVLVSLRQVGLAVARVSVWQHHAHAVMFDLQVYCTVYLFSKGTGYMHAQLSLALLQLLVPTPKHSIISREKTTLWALLIFGLALYSLVHSPTVDPRLGAAVLMLGLSTTVSMLLVPRPADSPVNPIELEPSGAVLCTQILAALWALIPLAVVSSSAQPWPQLTPLPGVNRSAFLFFTSLLTGNLLIGQWLLTQQSTPQFVLSLHMMALAVPSLLLQSTGWVDKALLVCLFLWGCTCHGANRALLLQPKPNVPVYLYMITSLADTMCLTLATLIFWVAHPLLNFASWLAPDPFRFYCYPGAISGCGPNVELGVAYLATGKPHGKPEIFHLNVGHLSNDEDFIRTGEATYKMMQSLAEDPEAGEKGFVANLVALIPKQGPMNVTRGYRQYNLSVWESTKAARDWYVSNEDHVKIVQKYRTQGMSSFGAMLSQLEPSPNRPIRWQVSVTPSTLYLSPAVCLNPSPGQTLRVAALGRVQQIGN